MVTVIKQSGKVAAYVSEYVCDTAADLAELPNTSSITPGSTATVIEPFGVYMLNSKDVWVKI